MMIPFPFTSTAGLASIRAAQFSPRQHDSVDMFIQLFAKCNSRFKLAWIPRGMQGVVTTGTSASSSTQRASEPLHVRSRRGDFTTCWISPLLLLVTMDTDHVMCAVLPNSFKKKYRILMLSPWSNGTQTTLGTKQATIKTNTALWTQWAAQSKL